MQKALLEQIGDLAALGQPGGKPVLVVDADRIVYLAALIAEEIDASPYDIDACLKKPLGEFHESVSNAFQEYYQPPLVFCLSSYSFRHQLLPTYKANRAGRWNPPMRKMVEEHFKHSVNALQVPGYEADDLVSIICRKSKNAVCVSNDKDLLQVPGQHYNPQKDEVFGVSEQEARYHRYYQWIAGDPGDGYSGIPKVGHVKTTDFLYGIRINTISDEEAFKHVRGLYRKKEVGHLCETMRRVSWILDEVLGVPGL